MSGEGGKKSAVRAAQIAALISTIPQCTSVAGIIFMTIRHLDRLLTRRLSALREAKLRCASSSLLFSLDSVIAAVRAPTAFSAKRLHARFHCSSNSSMRCQVRRAAMGQRADGR
jgi:hypothetical protein